MEKATRKYLAKVAGKAARIPFHGCVGGKGSNLEPIIRFFPKWTLMEADGLWCAAFVYYCCREAGFEIPIRPDACKTCHLAGCIAWEEYAMSDPQITYDKGGEGFVPEAGDIVLYDRVFENREHDHIGIVIENRSDAILTAEGNLNNASGIIERPKDEHIRGYIRIPDGYRYQKACVDHRTENLILHFVTEDDLPEVARTWPSDHHPLSDREAREAIASMRGNYGKNAKGGIFHLCLAMCGQDHPGTIMGWCGLDGRHDPTEPEIFILLDEAYRNQGYGTQCVKELLRIAVEDYALLRVHGGCAKENIASARAMIKGGMVQYGKEENGDPLFRFCVDNGSCLDGIPEDRIPSAGGSHRGYGRSENETG
ncbi:MAG: GNAT family N-acetyltransferase [Clostridia bacterium]|nr:GNAT family N-acetyltransferase [Clostridia bacterium]